MSVPTLVKACECGDTFETGSNRSTQCEDCQRTKECARCGELYRQRAREKLCGPCRFDSDSKVSQCAFCCEYYVSHGESPSEVRERMHHFKAQCLSGI